MVTTSVCTEPGTAVRDTLAAARAALSDDAFRVESLAAVTSAVAESFVAISATTRTLAERSSSVILDGDALACWAMTSR